MKRPAPRHRLRESHARRTRRDGAAPRTSKLAHAIYGNHPLSEDREREALKKISQAYPDVKGIKNTKAFARLSAKYQQRRMERLASKL